MHRSQGCGHILWQSFLYLIILIILLLLKNPIGIVVVYIAKLAVTYYNRIYDVIL